MDVAVLLRGCYIVLQLVYDLYDFTLVTFHFNKEMYKRFSSLFIQKSQIKPYPKCSTSPFNIIDINWLLMHYFH